MVAITRVTQQKLFFKTQKGKMIETVKRCVVNRVRRGKGQIGKTQNDETSVSYYNGGYKILCICQNPKNFPTQRVNLN